MALMMKNKCHKREGVTLGPHYLILSGVSLGVDLRTNTKKKCVQKKPDYVLK